MPERIDFWGIPETWGSPQIYLYSLLGIATLILAYRFYKQASLWWRIGRPEPRWNKIHIRLGMLIKYAIIQTKVLYQRYPGIMHITIAWSFFVFFLGTALATIDSHFFKFLQGNTFLAYKFILDAFTALFLTGVVMAAYRRYVEKPQILSLEPRFTLSLVLLVTIVLGGLVTESLRLAVEQPEWAIWSPFGWLIAQIWIATNASEASLLNWHLGIWIFHFLTVGLTLVILPVGTLVHLLTGPLNAFFSKIDQPMGRLSPVSETSEGEPIYVSSLKDLNWKQLLDGDACTECGRCQDACPAYASGSPLNPKHLILTLRDSIHQDGPALLSGSGNGNVPALVGERVQEIVLWSCTTCGACIRECPVLVEHVDTIVDMRRHLIIEGNIDSELQDALANLGRYGNSFGKSPRARARWSRRFDPKIRNAVEEPVEYLWFVGDYASYNATLEDITKTTAAVFNAAGIDFGILYEAEKHSGNDVRRVGEEGLYEMLVEENVAVLEKSEYKAIVTTDPHSYNTLKNEYPSSVNGSKAILHYAELLDQLIFSGKLQFKKKLNYQVTFHDPCYLSRYNSIYEAPRRVIEATGCQITEMPRNRENTFCCGAGGGRIWMHEIPDLNERPAEIRIREASNLPSVSTLVVACPKDLVMFRDAIKTTGVEETLAVKDLIELVNEALELEEPGIEETNLDRLELVKVR